MSSDTDAKIEALVSEWMYLPDISEQWGVLVTEVRQMVKDHKLIAFRRGANRSLQVPAAFIDGPGLTKHLAPTLTLLQDAKFTDEEIIEWLFTEDETLPGSPIQALQENRGTEVKRRAQAMLI